MEKICSLPSEQFFLFISTFLRLLTADSRPFSSLNEIPTG